MEKKKRHTEGHEHISKQINAEEEDSDMKERNKDDKKIVNKFELVDPHPLYCEGRYAFVL
jgi:hypothetical protein